MLSRFAVVLPLAFGAAMMLESSPNLAWTIGLGSPPWEWQRKTIALAQD